MNKVYRQSFLTPVMITGGLASLCALLYLGAFTSGCSILGGGANSVVTDTNTINTVSNYLEVAVNDAVTYGLSKDSTNTTAYASLASAAIGEVVGGTDFTPGALQAAIDKLPVSVLQTPVATLLTTTIESLYQIYWASDVNGAVNGDYAAKTYLSAVQAGINQALAGHPSAVPLSKLKRPVPRRR